MISIGKYMISVDGDVKGSHINNKQRRRNRGPLWGVYKNRIK